MLELRSLDKRRVTPSRLVELHLGYGPDEILSRLGPKFLEAYYAVFLEVGSTGGMLAYWDGSLAGFCLHAENIGEVYKTLIKRHFLQVCWAVGWYFLTHPKHLLTFGSLVSWLFNEDDKVVGRYTSGRSGRYTQFILTLVHGDYRTRQFVAHQGVDIARAVVTAVQEQVVETGMKGIFQMIGSYNRPVKMLMRACGFETAATFHSAGFDRELLVWEARGDHSE